MIRKKERDRMNLQMSTAVDLETIETNAREAQAAVINIVNKEKDLLDRIEELSAQEGAARYEDAVHIYLDAKGIIEIHKALKDQVNRVQKRVESIVEKLDAKLLEEVEEDGGEVETVTFELRRIGNPVSVNITDKEKVPKDFRTEPKPIPPWKEWAPDKNAIKKALVNKVKRSIAGAELTRTYRLDIKRK